MSGRRRKTTEEMSLAEVADYIADASPNSAQAHIGKAELLLREAHFQQRQAAAAEETATETTKYTRYMFWSVLVLAIASSCSLIVTGCNLLVNLIDYLPLY